MKTNTKNLTKQLEQNLTDYSVYKAVAPHISEPTLDTSLSDRIDSILLIVTTLTMTATILFIINTLRA